MSDTAALVAFLAQRYAEAWCEARDAELMAGLVTSRATRDVTAKRVVLERCALLAEMDPCDIGDAGVNLAVLVLRHLGSVFLDHPDYRPAWAPEGAGA